MERIALHTRLKPGKEAEHDNVYAGLFDTAPHYGLGLPERRLSAVLGIRPRDEFVLSTGRLPHKLRSDGAVGGSDSPVSLLAAPYREVLEALAAALPARSPAEQAAISAGAARCTYRL